MRELLEDEREGEERERDAVTYHLFLGEQRERGRRGETFWRRRRGSSEIAR